MTLRKNIELNSKIPVRNDLNSLIYSRLWLYLGKSYMLT